MNRLCYSTSIARQMEQIVLKMAHLDFLIVLDISTALLKRPYGFSPSLNEAKSFRILNSKNVDPRFVSVLSSKSFYPMLYINIVKCHAYSANRCIVDSMHDHLCAVYLVSILQHIGMGIGTIEDDVAFHACDSPRISNRVDGVNNPCPSVVNNAKIAVGRPPI